MSVRAQARPPDPNIDRGWAIPLLFCSSFCLALVFGVSFSSAIFYVVFLEAFQRSPTDTAWVVALNSCVTYMLQPIASLVSKRWGSAWSVTVGALLSSVGLMFATFSQNLLGLCIAYGLVTGLGWAFVSIGVFHGIFLFFKRYRKLAIALTTLGISIGQFVYPPFLRFLFACYDWRGTILILSGLNLNILVLAAISIAGKSHQLSTPVNESLMETSTMTVVTSDNAPAEKSRLDDLKEFVRLVFDPFCFLLNFSTVVAALGVTAYQTHITRAALLAGHGDFRATMLPSAIGAAGIFGRIGYGTLAQQFRRAGVVWLTVGSYGSLVIIVLICVLTRSYVALLVSSILFGALTGVWAVLPEVIATVAGVERIVAALGLNGFFCGLGMLAGPPLVAWLSEADPTYRLSFAFTTGSFFLSCLLLLPSAIKKKALD